MLEEPNERRILGVMGVRGKVAREEPEVVDGG